MDFLEVECGSISVSPYLIMVVIRGDLGQHNLQLIPHLPPLLISCSKAVKESG